MARYKRRRQKSYVEEIFGLAIILSIAASFSPQLREVLFSFFKLAFFALIASFVVIIYKASKTKGSGYFPKPAPPRRNRSASKISREAETEFDFTISDLNAAHSARWAFGSGGNPPPVVWTIDLLRNLEWKRFETVCSEFLKSIGYDARETRIGPDGGVDIVVHKKDQVKPLAIVQCKAWNKYRIGVKPIRELFGLMAAERVSHGMFITTAVYTDEAEEFAKGKNLQLITGERLLGAIKKLPLEKKESLLALATAGDYTTPTCPRCGIKMTTRKSSKGRNAGNKFWGCVSYPRCRSTLAYK